MITNPHFHYNELGQYEYDWEKWGPADGFDNSDPWSGAFPCPEKPLPQSVNLAQLNSDDQWSLGFTWGTICGLMELKTYGFLEPRYCYPSTVDACIEWNLYFNVCSPEYRNLVVSLFHKELAFLGYSEWKLLEYTGNKHEVITDQVDRFLKGNLNIDGDKPTNLR